MSNSTISDRVCQEFADVLYDEFIRINFFHDLDKFIIDKLPIHVIKCLIVKPDIDEILVSRLLKHPGWTQQDVIDNPNYNWDDTMLIKQFGWEFLVEHPNLDWNFNKLSDIVADFNVIEKTINKPWVFETFPNGFLPRSDYVDFVRKHIDKDWNWSRMTYFIGTELILEFPDKNWDWFYGLSNRNDVTENIVEENIDKHWDFKKLSKNPNLSIDFIDKYFDKNWDWTTISTRIDIPVDFLLKYIDKPIKYTDRFQKDLRKQDLLKYMNKFHYIDWTVIDNLTDVNGEIIHVIDIIQEDMALMFGDNRPAGRDFPPRYLNKAFGYHTIDFATFRPYLNQLSSLQNHMILVYKLVEKSDIVLDDIIGNVWLLRYTNAQFRLAKKHPDIMAKLMKNHLNIMYLMGSWYYYEGLTENIVEEHIDGPWKWDNLSHNVKFSFEFIIKYKKRMKWHPAIIAHMVKGNCDDYLANKFRERYAVAKIEQQWLKCQYNPGFKKCRKRIQNEYTSLQNEESSTKIE